VLSGSPEAEEREEKDRNKQCELRRTTHGCRLMTNIGEESRTILRHSRRINRGRGGKSMISLDCVGDMRQLGEIDKWTGRALRLHSNAMPSMRS